MVSNICVRSIKNSKTYNEKTMFDLLEETKFPSVKA
jgi:hypothetical protein